MTMKEKTNNFKYIADNATDELKKILNVDDVEIVNASFYKADLFVDGKHIAISTSTGEQPFDKPDVKILEDVIEYNLKEKVSYILGSALSAYQCVHYAYNLQPK